MEMSNNTVLITGGSSGIGLEFAIQLLNLNNNVIVTGRDMAKLDEVKKSFPKIHTIQSDVSKSQEIVELFSKVTKNFPNLNILINNAGIMRTINLIENKAALKDSDEFGELLREIEINLGGPIQMVKQFTPFLRSKERAAIVNISSGLAFSPLPSSPVYSAAKAGLHSLTLSLRVQLQGTSVKVFEVAPPATQTELLGDFDPIDMKGVSIMKADEMVKISINGMSNDNYEIRPGQSNQLRLMSRIAPNFILKQMSKPALRMLLNDSKK